jgi:hypothetical protein
MAWGIGLDPHRHTREARQLRVGLRDDGDVVKRALERSERILDQRAAVELDDGLRTPYPAPDTARQNDPDRLLGDARHGSGGRSCIPRA